MGGKCLRLGRREDERAEVVGEGLWGAAVEAPGDGVGGRWL